MRLREKMLIALSSYSTHKDYDLETWMAIRKEARTNGTELHTALKRIGGIS